ncbi:MAG: GNAT family N-acetyltransferase [Verrucomicrobia bacterium]|nr:GNAT family N-acetyltransferase [Verrucomicrobiota bacterium]
MDIRSLSHLPDSELLALVAAANADARGIWTPSDEDLVELRQAAVAIDAEEDRVPVGFAVAGPSGTGEVWALQSLAVVPRMRRQGVGSALLAEVLAAATSAGAKELRTGVLDSRNVPALGFMARHGFEPRGVIKLRMRRPNLENLPPVELPAGYTLRHYRGGDEAVWMELFHRIFADDPRSGVPPMTLRDLRDEFLSSPNWKPERLWFALAPDGKPVGMAMAWMRMEDNQAVASLHWVGVLAAHRGRRLGEALSLACLHQHQRDGWPDCWLPTESFRISAVQTYERLGFSAVYSLADYARPI